MFIFLRLFLAHLIGDFPLQTSAIYSQKVKSRFGPLLHVLVVISVMVILTIPFLNSAWMWLIIIINLVGHYIQDWTKLAIVQRLENKNNFWVFFIDQIFHILSAGIVFLTPVKNLEGCSDTSGFLCRLYSDNQLIALLAGWIFCSFAGTFIIACIKDTFLPQRYRTPFLEPIDRIYGLAERTLFFLLLNQSMAYGFLLPLFVFLKFLFANFQIKRLQGNHWAYVIDTLLGFLISAMAVIWSRVMA